MNKRIKKKHKKLGKMSYKEYREVLRSFKKVLRSGDKIKLMEWALSHGLPKPPTPPVLKFIIPRDIEFTYNDFPDVTRRNKENSNE